MRNARAIATPPPGAALAHTNACCALIAVMGCGASTAAPVEVPESVAFFFNGEPMAGKAEKYMTEYVADEHTLEFVGPHALPLMLPHALLRWPLPSPVTSPLPA